MPEFGQMCTVIQQLLFGRVELLLVYGHAQGTLRIRENSRTPLQTTRPHAVHNRCILQVLKQTYETRWKVEENTVQHASLDKPTDLSTLLETLL